MSIRIRTVSGVRVALCAARSMAQPGDVYLDDADHHALASKFTEDFVSEGGLCAVNQEEAVVRSAEERNNPNRTWWDQTYGSVPVLRPPGEAPTDLIEPRHEE